MFLIFAVSSDDTLKLNRKAEEVSLGDQIKRAAAIEEIDSAGFVQSEFKSNRAEVNCYAILYNLKNSFFTLFNFVLNNFYWLN